MQESLHMRNRYLPPFIVSLALCIIGVLAGLVYYKSAQERYIARITIAPPSDSNSTQQVSGSLGVLAGIAGAGGETLDSHHQFLFQLTSYETATKLRGDHALIEGLRQRHKTSNPATTSEIYSYITDVLRFDKPRGGLLDKSPLSIISVKDQDPVFASHVLTQVITQSDDIVRNRRLSELSGRRTKIVEALQQVTTAEYREALIRLLSQVERERLFGSVDIHYGFRIVDPLTQSDKPVDPNRFFSVAIGLFVGFALSAIFLIYWFLRVTLVPSVQSDHD